MEAPQTVQKEHSDNPNHVKYARPGILVAASRARASSAPARVAAQVPSGVGGAEPVLPQAIAHSSVASAFLVELAFLPSRRRHLPRIHSRTQIKNQIPQGQLSTHTFAVSGDEG